MRWGYWQGSGPSGWYCWGLTVGEGGIEEGGVHDTLSKSVYFATLVVSRVSIRLLIM
ncbi:hypothetical protein EMIT047CA2_80237 [Pseudomonas soli]